MVGDRNSIRYRLAHRNRIHHVRDRDHHLAGYVRIAHLRILRTRGQCFFRLQPAGLNELPQVRAVHELHDEVVQPVGLPKIEDGDDVLVAQFGQRAGFAREAFGKRRIGTDLRRQDLYRHQPIQPRLARLVNRTHPAFTQQLDDLKLRKVLGQLFRLRRDKAGRQRRRLHPRI